MERLPVSGVLVCALLAIFCPENGHSLRTKREAPTIANLTLVSVSRESARLSWDLDDHRMKGVADAPGTVFVVTAGKAGQVDKCVQGYAGHSTNYNLVGLLPDTDYKVTILAYRRAGWPRQMVEAQAPFFNKLQAETSGPCQGDGRVVARSTVLAIKTDMGIMLFNGSG